MECMKGGMRVRTYNSGEYFGERALLLHEPRAATCIAVGAVTCVTLKKVRIMGRPARGREGWSRADDQS